MGALAWAASPLPCTLPPGWCSATLCLQVISIPRPAHSGACLNWRQRMRRQQTADGGSSQMESGHVASMMGTPPCELQCEFWCNHAPACLIRVPNSWFSPFSYIFLRFSYIFLRFSGFSKRSKTQLSIRKDGTRNVRKTRSI